LYHFRFSEIVPYSDIIVEGAIRSIALTGLTAAIGLLIGTALGLSLAYGSGPLNRIIIAYVEFIRNTPFLAQLFFLFFGLPSIGFRLTAWEAAVLALTVNFGAYATEIMRAGITAVPRSQIEAASSLGLNPWQIFSNVVAFQAVRNIYPSLTGQMVLLFLGSSVVSQIAVTELFHAGTFIDSRTFRSFETYTVISLIYLAMVIAFRGVTSLIWVAVFEKRA
jgi:polar amino acid transport system permease protein